MSPTVLTGLDVVRRDGLVLPGSGRAGILTNNATTDRDLRGVVEVFSEVAGLHLERIFSPQHGFAGEKQDNMVESSDGVHAPTGLPIISLYGRVREPEVGMFEGLEALLIDLPDVGTRVYTFLSTALLCLRAAARIGLPVVILDRPNPLGGTRVEGPLLRPGFESFVGMIPVPLRHGLTVAEYCRFGASALGLTLELRVIRCEGWRRAQLFPETGHLWVPPSPNLPTFDGALVYPGMVLLEGTNLSEGRGTTRPFELWGAPWLDPPPLRRSLDGVRGAGEGCILREVAFQPTFHKYAGETVRGFQVHVTDPARFRPVALAAALLAAVAQRHPDRFAWKAPPYEYEREIPPIDLITGSDAFRWAIEGGTPAAEIIASWAPDERDFLERRRPSLLYD